MNHRHRKVLHALFAHPVSANIDFKDVVHVLEELGAEVDNKSGNRIGVTLKGHTAAFSHAQHSLPKEEVAQIRKFLETCGVDPEAYPA
ncbi:MAG: type II toxin-antitoxin system HicA family toxin [Hyphomicrobiaceae bacterium]